MTVATYMEYEPLLMPLRGTAELSRVAAPYLARLYQSQNAQEVLNNISALLVVTPLPEVHKTLIARLPFQDIERLVRKIQLHNLEVLVVAFAAFNQEDLRNAVQKALT